MSRSYLRDKYMQKCFYWLAEFYKNIHRLDEKSKNCESPKRINTLCPGAWGFKQTGSRQGHQVRNEGRRISSGIIRAKLKQEAKREIEQSLNEN